MNGIVKKIKGSILQYAVVTAILIFFLVLSIVLLSHIQRFFRLQSQSFLEGISAVNEQIDAALQSDFVITESDLSTIKMDYLGAFQRVTASGSLKNSPYKKTALIGSLSDAALYLSDNNQPLVLVGNTSIKGNAYLPSAGVKAGSIAGVYFYGNKLIDEPVYTSRANLPKLNTGFLKRLDSIQSEVFIYNKEISNIEDLSTNSFLESEQVVYDNQPILITQNLVGNIIVISQSEIEIDEVANLKDITLIAPTVKVKSGFSGSVHIIASDSITIEKNVTLDYPSSLIVNEKRNIEQSFSVISIAANSKINGSILYIKNTDHKRQESNVLLAKDALVVGAVYCEANLELLGTVTGSVLTQQFISKQKGSIYLNHILDGTISNELNALSVGALPLENEEKTIIKWLY